MRQISLSSCELATTMDTGYIDKSIHILNHSWTDEELTYGLRELWTLGIDVNEKYISGISAGRSLVRHREGYTSTYTSLHASSTLRELITDFLKKLEVPVLNVEIHYSKSIGLYTLAILDCDARRALEYWLNIADKVREYDIPIFVRWIGDTNVAPEEMGAYIGKVLARINIFLATKEPLDIVKILKEEWGL